MANILEKFCLFNCSRFKNQNIYYHNQLILFLNKKIPQFFYKKAIVVLKKSLKSHFSYRLDSTEFFSTIITMTNMINTVSESTAMSFIPHY